MHTREFTTAELLAAEQKHTRTMELYRELAMRAIAFVAAERLANDRGAQLNAAYDALRLISAQPRVPASDKANAARFHQCALGDFQHAIEREGEQLDEIKAIARKLVAALDGNAIAPIALDQPIETRIEGEETWQPATWGDFLGLNADGLGEEEIADIRRVLEAGGTYCGGGGAAPMFSVRAIVKAGVS